MIELATSFHPIGFHTNAYKYKSVKIPLIYSEMAGGSCCKGECGKSEDCKCCKGCKDKEGCSCEHEKDDPGKCPCKTCKKCYSEKK